MLGPPGADGAAAAAGGASQRASRGSLGPPVWPSLRFAPPDAGAAAGAGARGAAARKGRGAKGAPASDGVEDSEATAWSQLAELYEGLGEGDVAGGLLARHLLRCPGECGGLGGATHLRSWQRLPQPEDQVGG
jgi:hypothetical protein